MTDHYTFSYIGDRDYNEDYTVTSVSENRACFIVCDGLGGQGKGDLASSLVAKSIQHSFQEKYTTEGFFERAFLDAEHELEQKKRELGYKREMMTTATALVIDGETAGWCHSGDSRLYLFMKNRLMKRTIDHSVPQMLVMSGEIKEKDIRFHPDRNRLLKVMGTGWDDLEADVSEEIRVEPGMAFLLCTDGFWENVDENVMQKLLKKSTTAKEWVEKMGEHARKSAKPGNMDNASAIGVIIV